jgi:glycosyltransferase involved in cell wall biosynthesis
MKAVVIAPAPPGVGGQGAAARDMAEALSVHGLSCSYVGPDTPGLLGRLARNRPLRRWPALGRALDRRAMRRRVPPHWDLAYSMPGFLPISGIGVRVLHQATHHPRHVLAAVDSARRQAGGGRGFMTLREARELEREIGRSDVIRTESAAVAEELVSLGVEPDRLVTAHPGVDCERFRPRPPYPELTVAFVGVLSLWKGADLVVGLAERLRGRARTGVVGGPVCPWSRSLVAAAPLDRHHDVQELLGRAHALVLPSATDGFGYVVLEAMASGAVPFVSPEVGAAEIVRRLDDRLVQPRPSFVAAVSELLEVLPLAELSRRARSLAEQFDRKRMSELAAAAVLGAVRHHAAFPRPSG